MEKKKSFKEKGKKIPHLLQLFFFFKYKYANFFILAKKLQMYSDMDKIYFNFTIPQIFISKK